MAENPKADPTQAAEFQRVLKNLLTTPHKPQSELKVGKPHKAVQPATAAKARRTKANLTPER